MAEVESVDNFKNKVLFKEDIELDIKNYKDILSELNFHNENEMLICDSIISNLEEYAAKNIKDGKNVQLPYIGVIRKNPIRIALKSIGNDLRKIRKQVDKHTFKGIVRDKVKELKIIQNELDNKRVEYNKLKSKFKVKYDEYAKKLGIEFAEMWLFSRTLFEYIPFDEEVQEMYDRLNNKHI